MAAWSRKTWKIFAKISHFWKNYPLWENFQNFVPKRFIVTQIDVLCSNFVKFDRREISKVVRYLPAKKFVWLSCSRFCTDRTQNLPRPNAGNFLDTLKIHPNLLTFGGFIAECVNTIKRRCKSISNIRLEPSFEPNNYKFAMATNKTTCVIARWRQLAHYNESKTKSLLQSFII